MILQMALRALNQQRKSEEQSTSRTPRSPAKRDEHGAPAGTLRIGSECYTSAMDARFEKHELTAATRQGFNTPQSKGAVVWWWEWRRLVFNLVILTAGFASLYGMERIMQSALPDGEDAIEPLVLTLGIIIYLLLINLFYTLGWVIELERRNTDPSAAHQCAIRMFRKGLFVFSVITTIPFLFSCVYWIIHGSQHR
jgi:hypothetical protein